MTEGGESNASRSIVHGRVSIQYFLASSVQDAAERSPSDSSGNFNPTFVEGDVRGWGLRRTIGVAASYLWSTEATLAGLICVSPAEDQTWTWGSRIFTRL